ncbi:hypothetical protein N0V94_007683 [Neodidymelliopsis sp. IMI 364377]|nr:hypothetical protein N0V94_007683 [Neodidymelliopsis sp. IMI 364377]
MDNFRKKGRSMGNDFLVSNIAAASGLVLADEEPEEEPLSPPATARKGSVAYAALLAEAKAGSIETDVAQETKPERKEIATKQVTAQPAYIDQTPTGFPSYTEGNEKTSKGQKDIEKVPDVIETSVSLCQNDHYRLVCYWSYFDPINVRGTWRLERTDRHNEAEDIQNRAKEHRQCERMQRSAILQGLTDRMIQYYDYYEQLQHSSNIRLNIKDRGERSGRPVFMQIRRALDDLLLEFSCNQAMDKKKNEAKANIERYRKLMKERTEAKLAGQARIEKQAKSQRQNQNMASNLQSFSDVMKSNVHSRSNSNSPSPQTTTRHKDTKPRGSKKASRLESKRKSAVDQTDRPISGSELKKKQQQRESEHEQTPGPETVEGEIDLLGTQLTEAEQEMLRSVNEAQRKEAEEFAEAKREEEEMLQQLAEEQEGVYDGEEGLDHDDDSLAAAIEEATGSNSSIEPVSPEKKGAEQQQTSISDSPSAESPASRSEAFISSSSPDPMKRNTKSRPRPIVRDSSDESDTAKPPRRSTTTIKAIPKPKDKFSEHLAAKSTTKIDKTLSGRVEKRTATNKRSSTTPPAKSTPQTRKRSKTKNGRAYKSEETVVDSDSKSELADDGEQPASNLEDSEKGTKISDLEDTTVPADDYSESVVETIETGPVEANVSSPRPSSPQEQLASPSSPGSPAASTGSASSSSSPKKRKSPSSEERGEGTSSPGGTKRVKHVRFSDDIGANDVAETSQVAREDTE